MDDEEHSMASGRPRQLLLQHDDGETLSQCAFLPLELILALHMLIILDKKLLKIYSDQHISTVICNVNSPCKSWNFQNGKQDWKSNLFNKLQITFESSIRVFRYENWSHKSPQDFWSAWRVLKGLNGFKRVHGCLKVSTGPQNVLKAIKGFTWVLKGPKRVLKDAKGSTRVSKGPEVFQRVHRVL